MPANPSNGHTPQPQLYPIVEIFSIDSLKDNYLFGIEVKDPVTDCPPKDAFYQFHIRNAIAYVERELNIKISPTEIVDEQHDYDLRDYRNFGFLQLNQWPVLKVNKFYAVYPLLSSIFPSKLICGPVMFGSNDDDTIHLPGESVVT